MIKKLVLITCETFGRSVVTRIAAIAGAALILAALGSQVSQANLIGTSSFEFTITPTGGGQTYYQRFGTDYTAGPIVTPSEAGWTVTNRVDVYDTSASDYPTTRPAAYDGKNYLELNGVDSPAPASAAIGTISQAFATVFGQKYALKFYYIPSIQGRPPNPDVASVGVTGSGSLFSGTITYTDNGTPGPNVNPWLPYNATFIADSTSTTLTFASTQPGNFGVGLDAISVIAVPEPTTFALWSIGLVGMGLGASRRRRK